jgi:type VI secretion system Hcp family effector
MKMIVVSLLVLAVVAVGMPAFMHPNAFQSYVSFKGTKQGQLKGESEKTGREKDGWFNVIAFDMGSERPIDAAQSTASGKRKHAPFVITREVDEATPLLMQALSSNEVFETVTIQTFDDKKLAKTVVLSNAVLTSVHKDGTKETATFTYDRLTMTN